MFKEATYVSVWDGGTEIRTACLFNPETKEVKDIESADVNVDVLEDEYVEFEDEEIRDFINLDDSSDEDTELTEEQIRFIQEATKK